MGDGLVEWDMKEVAEREAEEEADCRFEIFRFERVRFRYRCRFAVIRERVGGQRDVVSGLCIRRPCKGVM